MTCSTEALLWHRCDIRRLSAAIQHYYVHYFSLCLKAFEFSLEGIGAFPVCVYVSQSWDGKYDET